MGGSETAPHQFPWMAGIYVNGYLFCGGTFISEHYVLTAAHCVDGGFYFDILAGGRAGGGSDRCLPNYDRKHHN